MAVLGASSLVASLDNECTGTIEQSGRAGVLLGVPQIDATFPECEYASAVLSCRKECLSV